MTACNGPVIGRDPYPLPPLPAGVSPTLLELTTTYAAEFAGTDDGCADRWDAVAIAIGHFVPVTAADASVKLMYGLHYLHPAQINDRLAIDTEHFACDAAAAILIACMNEQRAACASLTWDAALADYEAKRAASDAMPLDTDGEDAAVDAYCVAMDHLIVSIPAPDVAAASIKADLAAQREGCDYLWVAVRADLRRLAGRGAA